MSIAPEGSFFSSCFNEHGYSNSYSTSSEQMFMMTTKRGLFSSDSFSSLPRVGGFEDNVFYGESVIMTRSVEVQFPIAGIGSFAPTNYVYDAHLGSGFGYINGQGIITEPGVARNVPAIHPALSLPSIEGHNDVRSLCFDSFCSIFFLSNHRRGTYC